MTDQQKMAIVLFAKAPEVGNNKSRLAKSLGWQAATDIHHAMAKDIWNKMIGTGFPLVLSSDTDRAWLPYADHCIEQPDGDFGTRIKLVFEKLQRQGFEYVVSFGADTPHLPYKIMISAIDHLIGGAELVSCPADDGGLVLLGMRLPAAFDIAEMPFETDGLENAVDKAGAGMNHRKLGPGSYDIDDIDDVRRLLNEHESVFEECPLTIAVLRTMDLPAD